MGRSSIFETGERVFIIELTCGRVLNAKSVRAMEKLKSMHQKICGDCKINCDRQTNYMRVLNSEITKGNLVPKAILDNSQRL